MGSGKSLELFPTILTALAATETLAYGKGNHFCTHHISVFLMFSVNILLYHFLLFSVLCFFFCI